MRNEIISVIGGSGFVGRYVVKRLTDAGYRVRVLCRKPHLADFLKPSGNVGQIVLDYADLSKPETVSGKLEGSYGVINLVGIMHEGGSQKFARIHAQGAEKVAQEATKAGAETLVHVSALGANKAQHSAYARTKLEGEKAVSAAFKGATIVRPGLIFGAEDRFFNMFARLSQYAPVLPAIGGGKTKLQPVYVDDVAHAIEVILELPQADGKNYELGGPDIYTLKEMLRYLGETTGHQRPLVPVPFSAAKIIGAVAQQLPRPIITQDQVRLLENDTVVDKKALGFKALGIVPSAMKAIIPTYLDHRKQAA